MGALAPDPRPVVRIVKAICLLAEQCPDCQIPDSHTQRSRTQDSGFIYLIKAAESMVSSDICH
jgi:hypothetical protein